MDLDHGREFDFGRTSEMYARYRDIYPPAFFRPLLDRGLCVRGQAVLDLGTGTGVLPRSLYSYGAAFTGIDSSANQIEQAKALAKKGRPACFPASGLTLSPPASALPISATRCSPPAFRTCCSRAEGWPCSIWRGCQRRTRWPGAAKS